MSLTLERKLPERCFLFSDADCGLRAVLVIDSLALGPAAGGIRTKAYPTMDLAIEDAARLAEAMTLKCAIAGLDAGGAKMVVLDHPGLDRQRAFERVGQFVEELGGVFRTAGDLGTTPDDLNAVARHTGYVHTDTDNLSRAVARGLVRCMESCAALRGYDNLAGLKVAVQGCGDIGEAVCRFLGEQGVKLILADIDSERAASLARQLGAHAVGPDDILTCDVDIVAPCAVGGVVDDEVARAIRAWAVCGAANNILKGPGVAEVLLERGVTFVPDLISSAGAVIDGIGSSLMGLAERGPLIDALGSTATDVLERATASGRSPAVIARQMALERIAAALAR